MFNPQPGDRKYRHAQFMALILLLGLGFILLSHGDNALFATFTMGIGGLSGAFMVGNVKEHAINKGAANAASIASAFMPPGPRTPDTQPPFATP